MAAVPPFTSTNVKEAWLIKALRLLYSQKPEDGVRLRRFYKDACDNEAHVLRTTLSEALRESREDGSERSSFATGRPRISAPSSLGSASSSPLTEVSLHSAAVVGGCVLPPASASSSDHSDSGSNSGPVSSALPPAKRHKVGFFNIFDPPSSSTVEVTGGAANVKYRSSSSNTPPTPVTIAAPVVVCQSQPINKDSVSLVATTEVISLQEAPTESQHIASTATGAASAVPTSSNRDSVSDGADVMADIVADLACRVCGRLITNHPDPSGGYSGNGGGTNAMIECSLCHGLYHQLCHTPPVLGRLPATNVSAWTCSTCSSLTHQPEPTPSASESPVVTTPSLPNPITPNSSVSRRKRQSSAVVPSPRQQRN